MVITSPLAPADHDPDREELQGGSQKQEEQPLLGLSAKSCLDFVERHPLGG